MTVEVRQVGPGDWEQRVFSTSPPHAAFDYIADFSRHTEWEHELLTVQQTGAAGPAYLKTYGTRSSGLVGRIFSPGVKVTCKLTEVARPRRIVWKQYRSRTASGPDKRQTL